VQLSRNDQISVVLATPSLRELASLIRVLIDFVPVTLISGSLDGYLPSILCEMALLDEMGIRAPCPN